MQQATKSYWFSPSTKEFKVVDVGSTDETNITSWQYDAITITESQYTTYSATPPADKVLWVDINNQPIWAEAKYFFSPSQLSFYAAAPGDAYWDGTLTWQFDQVGITKTNYATYSATPPAGKFLWHDDKGQPTWAEPKYFFSASLTAFNISTPGDAYWDGSSVWQTDQVNVTKATYDTFTATPPAGKFLWHDANGQPIWAETKYYFSPSMRQFYPSTPGDMYYDGSSLWQTDQKEITEAVYKTYSAVPPEGKFLYSNSTGDPIWIDGDYWFSPSMLQFIENTPDSAYWGSPVSSWAADGIIITYAEYKTYTAMPPDDESVGFDPTTKKPKWFPSIYLFSLENESVIRSIFGDSYYADHAMFNADYKIITKAQYEQFSSVPENMGIDADAQGNPVFVPVEFYFSPSRLEFLREKKINGIYPHIELWAADAKPITKAMFDAFSTNPDPEQFLAADLNGLPFWKKQQYYFSAADKTVHLLSDLTAAQVATMKEISAADYTKINAGMAPGYYLAANSNGLPEIKREKYYFSPSKLVFFYESERDGVTPQPTWPADVKEITSGFYKTISDKINSINWGYIIGATADGYPIVKDAEWYFSEPEQAFYSNGVSGVNGSIQTAIPVTAKKITAQEHSKYAGYYSYTHEYALGFDAAGKLIRKDFDYWYDPASFSLGYALIEENGIPKGAVKLTFKEFTDAGLLGTATDYVLKRDAAGKFSLVKAKRFYSPTTTQFYREENGLEDLPSDAKEVSEEDYQQYQYDRADEQRHLGFDAHGKLQWVAWKHYYAPSTAMFYTGYDKYLGTAPTDAKLISDADYLKYKDAVEKGDRHLIFDAHGAWQWVDWKYYFSASEKRFLTESEYIQAQITLSEPKDAVEITKADYDKYSDTTKVPRFYELGADGLGKPVWVELKKEDQMKLLTELKSYWMGIITSRINDIQACIADGVASDAQKAMLPQLRQFRIKMRDLDVATVPNVTYPVDPIPDWKYSWDAFGYYHEFSDFIPPFNS
ncbi:TPA: tail fiber assembly protein [Enterobacter hormaechei subsp. xiangfangensis]|nr:tail fiber assembly protein [Enterobacter hormaechei subsp. xiangfangensis]